MDKKELYKILDEMEKIPILPICGGVCDECDGREEEWEGILGEPLTYEIENMIRDYKNDKQLKEKGKENE